MSVLENIQTYMTAYLLELKLLHVRTVIRARLNIQYLELLLLLAGAVGMYIICHWEVGMANLRILTPLPVTATVTVTVTRIFGDLMCMGLHHVIPQGTVF